MPPYWDNKALPTPTLRYFYFQLFDYFLHIIKNKWLFDAIWDLKREKKTYSNCNNVNIVNYLYSLYYTKGGFELGLIVSTIYTTETDAELSSFF